MPKITVIIVNWNGAPDTIDCLLALERMDAASSDLSIIVVDNGSSDGSYEALASFLIRRGFLARPANVPITLSNKLLHAVKYDPAVAGKPPIVLIAAATNRGYAGGNNLAVEFSESSGSSDFFWFLNSDTEVEIDALVHVLNKMKSHPEVGICGSTLLHASDRRTVQAYGGSFYSFRTGRAWSPGAGRHYDPTVTDKWAEGRINYVSGAAMFVRSSLLIQIGLMSEDYFLYNEEIDLACRVNGKFRLGVATKSIVFHKIGSAIGTEGASIAASRLSTFYQTRSKLIFASKHSRMYYPVVWLTLLAKGVKLLRNRSRRAEANIIFRVLAGKWDVKPVWFVERQEAIVTKC